MALLEELKELGVNVDEGLKRINGNEKLYTRLLGTFVKTIDANYVAPDFDTSDCTLAVEKTHAIKGTSGNLSITPIYEAYSQIVDLIRSGHPEEAKPLLEKAIPVQEQIVACIKKHMS